MKRSIDGVKTRKCSICGMSHPEYLHCFGTGYLCEDCIRYVKKLDIY